MFMLFNFVDVVFFFIVFFIALTHLAAAPTRAERLFVEAARVGDDADVHIALGLLFNLSFEYQKATECFKV
jgi:hypothetical protein